MPVFNMMQGGGNGIYGTLPLQISDLTAIAGDTQVTLNWVNPVGNFSGTLIVKKADSYPSKPADGVKVYEGAAQEVTDTGLTNGTNYYYRAFAYNEKKEYQTIDCKVSAEPIESQKAWSMPIGSKIEFGKLNSIAIPWLIADKSGANILMVSENLLLNLAFDAKEPASPDTSCMAYGSRRYATSNIRQWLNSEAAAGDWYVSQSMYDAPPAAALVNNYPYADSAGFLNGFSVSEKSYLEKSEIKCYIGNTTETIQDKVFVPSAAEVGLDSSDNCAEVTVLEIFKSNSPIGLIGNFTFSQNAQLLVGSAGRTKLRTPQIVQGGSGSDYTARIRLIDADGSIGNALPYEMGGAIRPICCINKNTPVSLTANEAGYYHVL